MNMNLELFPAESFDFEEWSVELHKLMLEAVLATAFSNRMMMKPRKLKELVEDECKAFTDYVQSSTPIDPTNSGIILAQNGLGHESILAITTSIRRSYHYFLSDSDTQAFDIFELYCNTLINGYMTGREIEVRKEQERAHEAYIRILKKENT